MRAAYIGNGEAVLRPASSRTRHRMIASPSDGIRLASLSGLASLSRTPGPGHDPSKPHQITHEQSVGYLPEQLNQLASFGWLGVKRDSAKRGNRSCRTSPGWAPAGEATVTRLRRADDETGMAPGRPLPWHPMEAKSDRKFAADTSFFFRRPGLNAGGAPRANQAVLPRASRARQQAKRRWEGLNRTDATSPTALLSHAQ